MEALELTGTQKNPVIVGLETPSNALGRRNLFRYGSRKSHQGSAQTRERSALSPSTQGCHMLQSR